MTRLVTRQHTKVFTSKLICNNLNLLVIFIIYLQSATKVFRLTHWVTGSSVKSITGRTFISKCPWLVYTICVTFSFFLSDCNFFKSLLVFSNSKILIVLILYYPFPLLNWVIKLPLNWGTVSHMGIQKTIFSDKMIILSSLLTRFFFRLLACGSLIPLYSLPVITILFCYFIATLNVFSAFTTIDFQIIKIWERRKNLLELDISFD